MNTSRSHQTRLKERQKLLMKKKTLAEKIKLTKNAIQKKLPWKKKIKTMLKKSWIMRNFKGAFYDQLNRLVDEEVAGVQLIREKILGQQQVLVMRNLKNQQLRFCQPLSFQRILQFSMLMQKPETP